MINAQKKKRNRGEGVEDILVFRKTPGMVLVFLVPLKISGKTKLHSWTFCKMIYVTYLGNLKAKTKHFKRLHH